VKVAELRLLVKSLRPLPEKFHGLADQEQKYRQRYVDLIMSEETREVFQTRSRIVEAIREFMTAKGFLEVETPMMQPIPGGANARPFRTHHNAPRNGALPAGRARALSQAPGRRRIRESLRESNRNFRNEGISTRHNPEFTMLEFYEAYRDYRYLMDFTEEDAARAGEDGAWRDDAALRRAHDRVGKTVRAPHHRRGTPKTRTEYAAMTDPRY